MKGRGPLAFLSWPPARRMAVLAVTITGRAGATGSRPGTRTAGVLRELRRMPPSLSGRAVLVDDTAYFVKAGECRRGPGNTAAKPVRQRPEGSACRRSRRQRSRRRPGRPRAVAGRLTPVPKTPPAMGSAERGAPPTRSHARRATREGEGVGKMLPGGRFANHVKKGGAPPT